MHFKYITILLVKLHLNKTEKKFHILVLKTEYLDYTSTGVVVALFHQGTWSTKRKIRTTVVKHIKIKVFLSFIPIFVSSCPQTPFFPPISFFLPNPFFFPSLLFAFFYYNLNKEIIHWLTFWIESKE